MTVHQPVVSAASAVRNDVISRPMDGTSQRKQTTVSDDLGEPAAPAANLLRLNGATGGLEALDGGCAAGLRGSGAGHRDASSARKWRTW